MTFMPWMSVCKLLITSDYYYFFYAQFVKYVHFLFVQTVEVFQRETSPSQGHKTPYSEFEMSYKCTHCSFMWKRFNGQVLNSKNTTVVCFLNEVTDQLLPWLGKPRGC